MLRDASRPSPTRVSARRQASAFASVQTGPSSMPHAQPHDAAAIPPDPFHAPRCGGTVDRRDARRGSVSAGGCGAVRRARPLRSGHRRTSAGKAALARPRDHRSGRRQALLSRTIWLGLSRLPLVWRRLYGGADGGETDRRDRDPADSQRYGAPVGVAALLLGDGCRCHLRPGAGNSWGGALGARERTAARLAGAPDRPGRRGVCAARVLER